MKTIEQRFGEKLAADGECVVWTAHLSQSGYGRFALNGEAIDTHRWVYEVVNGPVPDGMEIDHLCGNRACQLPEHLEAVTHAENVRRGRAGDWQVAKTHCPSGHPYDEANTYTNKRGSRMCRACACERMRRIRAVIPQSQRKKRGACHAAKTHCPQGHPYSGDNLYICAKGKRSCRKCSLASSQASRLRRKQRSA